MRPVPAAVLSLPHFRQRFSKSTLPHCSVRITPYRAPVSIARVTNGTRERERDFPQACSSADSSSGGDRPPYVVPRSQHLHFGLQPRPLPRAFQNRPQSPDLQIDRLRAKPLRQAVSAGIAQCPALRGRKPVCGPTPGADGQGLPFRSSQNAAQAWLSSMSSHSSAATESRRGCRCFLMPAAPSSSARRRFSSIFCASVLERVPVLSRMRCAWKRKSIVQTLLPL